MKIQRNIQKSTAVTANTSTNYDDSIKHIRAAIDALGKSAKSDVVARDSIANLSVVLLDLQR